MRFATATPELYRIATMGPPRSGSDVDRTLALSAFVHMCDSVQELMDQGIYAPGDPTAAALELWSAAHGVAALLIAKPYLPFGDAEAFTDRVLTAVCTGHIVVGLTGPDATQEQTLDWLFDRKGVRS